MKILRFSGICVGLLMTFALQAQNNSQQSSEYDINAREAEQKKAAEEVSMYPFVKSSAVPTEGVAGVKVDGNKVILLSYDDRYSVSESNEEILFDQVDFFSKYPELQTVELSGIGLDAKKLENLQKFIPKNIKGLTVRNCEVPKDETSRLVDIIKVRHDLVSFSMFFPKCASEISTQFLEALDGYKDMRYLNFTFGHVTGAGCKMIAELLKNSAGTVKGVTIGIGVVEDDEKHEGLQAIFDEIKELSKLEKLEISFVELPEELSGELFTIIGGLESLKDLRLFFGNHKDYDQKKLFENIEVCRDSIEKLKHLETLDISSMQLTESFMQLLGQAVAVLPELRTLNISGNRLDEKAAEIFSNSFKNADKLQVLMADDCCMDAQIFTALTRNLGKTSLQLGYFGRNTIKDGIKNLPVSAIADLAAVDFSDNELGYGDVKTFTGQLKSNTSLKVINFGGNSGIMKASTAEKAIAHDELEQWKLKTFAEECAPALLGV